MAEDSSGVESTRWIVPVNKFDNEDGDLSLEFLSFGFSESMVLLWHGKRRKETTSHAKLNFSSRNRFSQYIIRIPDTLTSFEGKLSWFFYSEKKKSILKKNSNNVLIPNIMKSFQRRPIYQKPYTLRKNIHISSENKETKIVAMVIEEKRIMDGISMTSLQYFTKEQLVHHLRYNIPQVESTSNFLIIKHIPYVSRNAKSEYFDKLFNVKWTARSLFIESVLIKSPEFFEPERCYDQVPAHVKAQITKITESLAYYVKYLTDDLLKPRVINFSCKEDMYGNVWFLWLKKLITCCVEVKAPIRRIHYEMRVAYSMSSKEQIRSPIRIHTSSSSNFRLKSRAGQRSLISSQGGRRRKKSKNKLDLLPPKWTCPSCVEMKTDFLDRREVTYRTIIQKYESEEGIVTIPPVIQLADQKLNKYRYNRIRTNKEFLDRTAHLCCTCSSIFESFRLQNEFRKTEIRKLKKYDRKTSGDLNLISLDGDDSTDSSLLQTTTRTEETKRNTKRPSSKKKPKNGRSKKRKKEKKNDRKSSSSVTIATRRSRIILLDGKSIDSPPVYKSPSSRRRSRKRKKKMKKRMSLMRPKTHNFDEKRYYHHRQGKEGKKFQLQPQQQPQQNNNNNNNTRGSSSSSSSRYRFSRLRNGDDDDDDGSSEIRYYYHPTKSLLPKKRITTKRGVRNKRKISIVPLDVVRCIHSSDGPSSSNSPSHPEHLNPLPSSSKKQSSSLSSSTSSTTSKRKTTSFIPNSERYSRPLTMGGYGKRSYFTGVGKRMFVMDKDNMRYGDRYNYKAVSGNRRRTRKRVSTTRNGDGSGEKAIENVGQLKKMRSETLLRMIQEERDGSEAFQWVDL